MWPINLDLATNPTSPYTTAYDRLSAFCSTVAGSSGVTYPFYFQRRDSTSSKEESSIPRNTTLYKYLQSLTARSIPGWGATFSGKYTQDCNQILTEMFDYIRSTNLFDDNLGGAGTAAANPPYSPNGTNYGFTPGRTSQTAFQPGHGQVTPSVIGSTQGFARIQTISQVALHVICTADGTNPGSINTPAPPAPPTTINNPLMKTYLFGLGRQLKSTERIFQMAFYIQPFCPEENWDGLEPNLTYEVSGLPSLSVAASSTLLSTGPTGSPNPFPSDTNTYFSTLNANVNPNVTYTNAIYNSRAFGGTASFRTLMGSATMPQWAGVDTDPNAAANGIVKGNANYPFANNTTQIYPFVSAPFLVDTINTTTLGGVPVLNVSGGTVTIKIHVGNSVSSASVVQTLQFPFPAMVIPQPSLETTDMPAHPFTSSTGVPTTYPDIPPKDFWGFRYRIGLASNDTGLGMANGSLPSPGGNGGGQEMGCVIRQDADVVRSLVPSVGDMRLIAASNNSSAFTLISGYNVTPPPRLEDSLSDGWVTSAIPQTDSGSYTNPATARRLDTNVTTYTLDKLPDIPPGPIPNDPMNTLYSDLAGKYRDWDNGMAMSYDGAFINKPDEGNTYSIYNSVQSRQTIPYFEQTQNTATTGATFFSPNRIIPSPGMFGSLPSQVIAGTPWRTLLFRPQQNHPGGPSSNGGIDPPDHLFMDLFWMPLVQPYALSEPFASAGKVNMNYQIVPFTALRRDIALRAAMKSEQISVAATGAGGTYKGSSTAGPFLFNLDLAAPTSTTDQTTKTFRDFEATFAQGKIFSSATQICDIYLVPVGQAFSSDSAAQAFWDANRLTGDNSRERPYANLYGKLTTRSNTFTAHTRVQVLKKVVSSTPGTWTEGKDVVLSEYRGSTELERYIDPTSAMPDFAADLAANPNSTEKVSDYCRVRIVDARRFEP
jgi:hypothetical protein